MHLNKSKSNPLLKKLAFLPLVVTLTINCFAQDSIYYNIQKISISDKSDNQWRFKLEPNMLVPRLSANVGAGEFNVPIIGEFQPQIHVEQSPKEFYDRLKIGSMISIEGYNDNWAINGDFSYFILEQKIGKYALLDKVKIKATQFFGDITVFRRINSWLELGVGANIISANTKIEADITHPNNSEIVIYDLNVNKSRNWIDPMIAARISNKSDSKFLYMVRGDIGGFGLGSKLAWQTLGQVGYQFNKAIYGIVGYRYISIDYLKGAGLDRFKYDTHISGPMIKIGFNIP